MECETDRDDFDKTDEEKEPLMKKKRPSLFNFSISFKQLKFIIIVIVPALAPGIGIGFSGIALPQLNLDVNESSWFASLPMIGGILGTLITGAIIDRCGRKIMFILNTVPVFVGYILLASSTKTVYLYIGQVCVGLSQGGIPLVAVVYISESVVPDNLHFRSSLASWNVLAMTSGLSSTYILGYLLSYDQVALVAASLAFFSSILVLIFVPESPAWLDQRGMHKEAERARHRLGCANANVESPTAYQPIGNNSEVHENYFVYLMKIKREDVYKPLLLVVVYSFFVQFSGTQVYSAYMVDIIEVKSVNISPYLSTFICGCFIEIGQISYVILLPQLGMKKMAVISSIFASSATLTLGICITLQSDTVTWYSELIDYIHIFSVWCNTFFSALGIATIPFTIGGEIIPTDAKGLSSLPLIVSTMLYFINAMIFPLAIQLSPFAIFYFYAMVGFLAVPFVYYNIPETVGRTLEQISSGFSS